MNVTLNNSKRSTQSSRLLCIERKTNVQMLVHHGGVVWILKFGYHIVLCAPLPNSTLSILSLTHVPDTSKLRHVDLSPPKKTLLRLLGAPLLVSFFSTRGGSDQNWVTMRGSHKPQGDSWQAEKFKAFHGPRHSRTMAEDRFGFATPLPLPPPPPPA